MKIPGHYESDLRYCYEFETGKADLADCLARAEKERQSASDQWSFSSYYQSIFRGWVLPLVIIAPPILLYGLVWGITAVCAWIWRGFRPAPGKAP